MTALISQQSDFDALCERLQKSPVIAFDTEFVSEHTYRPKLCLLQFATAKETVAVDPLEGLDLTAWWELMANESNRIIIHGGREEILFCWHAIGKAPGNLVDIQIVQGLLSRGFPLSYSAIVQKVMKKKIHGKETRTDWAKRPLTDRQIEYALEDVRYLIEIAKKQDRRLKQRGRTEWASEECLQFVNGLIETQRTRSEAWTKLPKVSKLSGVELAIVQDLFLWRERIAEETNRPLRNILRDDLMVDLAHRHPRTEEEVMATRDMQRGSYRKHAEELVEVINKSSERPKSDWPAKLKPPEMDGSKQEEHVLSKLLAIALANCCAESDLSPAMVATANDLREFARWYSNPKSVAQPRLARGWRYELCGSLLEDLLDGKLYLRVADPESDHPLVFEPLPEKKKS